MLQDQIRKSANRYQRFVLKINWRAEQKSSESGFKSLSYEVALTYTIRRKAALTL